MSGPTFTLPPQIVDMLTKGLREMRPAPKYEIWKNGQQVVFQITMETDAGPIVINRGQDMERT